MTRTKIPQESRVKAELQKEIGSRCPFCPSEDVGHFQIHHIDENSSNNNPKNLLFLCQPCHSKFTKKEWPMEDARNMKDYLLNNIDYLNFQSESNNVFDYLCYDMQRANGRIPETNSNGSTMNISVTDRYHFKLILKQNDGRIWEGILNLENANYGTVFFRYTGNGEYEFGRRECYLKQTNAISGNREDSLYFKPLTDLKDYGDELVKRQVEV